MSESKYEIENRVTSSALVTIDLDDYLDKNGAIFFDLKSFLFQELILREKDFRLALKEHDWQQYTGKTIVVGCTADAIVPTWAYMLVTSKLEGIAHDVSFGEPGDLEKKMVDLAVDKVAQEDWKDKKVVIKGCGGISARDYAYTAVTRRLVSQVSSLMYGEPCSTVPIYKKPRKKAN